MFQWSCGRWELTGGISGVRALWEFTGLLCGWRPTLVGSQEKNFTWHFPRMLVDSSSSFEVLTKVFVSPRVQKYGTLDQRRSVFPGILVVGIYILFS